MNFEVFWKNEGLMFESIISPKTSLFLEIFSIKLYWARFVGIINTGAIFKIMQEIWSKFV
jgi:hypothetical protein